LCTVSVRRARRRTDVVHKVWSAGGIWRGGGGWGGTAAGPAAAGPGDL